MNAYGLRISEQSGATNNWNIYSAGANSRNYFEGTITTTEIVVTNTGWPDFVFEEDYELMPLVEVEQHIHAKKHLPGIPPAKEITANGVNLGDMQTKMLQKIEELTLYLIEQDKRFQKLEKENAVLKEQVAAIGSNVKKSFR